MNLFRSPRRNASSSNAPSEETTTTIVVANTVLEKPFNGLNIQVYGTYEEPLFKAKDIGDLLEMSNIRETISSFNNKQRRVSLTDTLGGKQEVTFLTEQGLYKVIMRSRKKIAEAFQDWVCEVIKEIRLKGKYDIEERLKEKELKEIEYRQQLQEKEQELLQYKEKTYEEFEKTGHIYVIKTDGGIKVGKTKDIVQKRVKGLQTGNVEDIQVLLDFKTSNEDILERMVHYVLDRYRCNSNREFFDCNLEYIKLVINVAGKTIDTLKSTYQHISEEELCERLNITIERENAVPPPPSAPPDYETTRNAYNQEFVNRYLEQRGGGVKWTDLYTKYVDWHVNEKGGLATSIDKKSLKVYFEKVVFKSEECPVRNVGRGWYGWSLRDELDSEL